MPVTKAAVFFHPLFQKKKTKINTTPKLQTEPNNQRKPKEAKPPKSLTQSVPFFSLNITISTMGIEMLEFM